MKFPEMDCSNNLVLLDTLFVYYPQKKHLGETHVLKSIAQTRENDLFAILCLPNHEYSLFLNLFRPLYQLGSNGESETRPVI